MLSLALFGALMLMGQVCPTPLVQTLRTSAYNVIGFDHHTFTTDGTDLWYAGSPYPNAFAADTFYAFSQAPEQFTAAQINNYVVKFVAAKNGNGDLPICLAPNTTACAFFSPNDTVHAYVGGDGWMFVPQMALLAYQKSGSLTTFNSVSAALKVAVQRVPLDATTHLVNTPTGQEWIPWGFMDGVEFGGGVNMMGSLGFYASTHAMAVLYTAAGDSTNAAIFASYASNITANIDTLWSSGDGMYHASTGTNNNQIDVIGSAYAVWLGLAPSHASTISAYLVTNYSSLTYVGFWRESNVNWGRFWGSRPHGTYDDGFWSVGNLWITSTVALTSPSQASTAVSAFTAGPDMTEEWYNLDHSTTGAGTQNLESPMGDYAYVVSQPTNCGSGIRGIVTLRGLVQSH